MKRETTHRGLTVRIHRSAKRREASVYMGYGDEQSYVGRVYRESFIVPIKARVDGTFTSKVRKRWGGWRVVLTRYDANGRAMVPKTFGPCRTQELALKRLKREARAAMMVA